MASTIPLLDHAPLTFEEAKLKDFDVIHRHKPVAQAKKLFLDLWTHRDDIAAITKKQLGLENGTECTIALPKDWHRGNFNVCIPIEVKSRQFGGKILMRCPMPLALRDAASVDEKLRGEVGAYIWMQEHCPEIRIPHLYGFSTSSGHATLPTQYMLLEYIGQDVGQMLSNTWGDHRNDPSRRGRLIHGLARIMISLSRIPQPRIGSFQFHDDCTVTLTNRPSLAATTILENRGAEPSIQHGSTYNCTEPYVADMITLHDNHFYSNQSAADDESDCRAQMAIRTMLRTLSHHYIQKDYRNGPFLLQLTDIHPSNIFVDNDWNITCTLDLEWLCALPPEALSAPYWLTGCRINEIVDKDEDERWTAYDSVRREFMQVFSEEEARVKLAWPLTTIMEDMWQSKGTWFWHCLESVDGAYYLMHDHLLPQFSAEIPDLDMPFSLLWKQDASQIVQKKLCEFDDYTQKLGRLYSPNEALVAPS
ncbi:hypothetical protein ED733_008680 [Metarhizium rileyi]|uniref:Uncharacterized protein n=1 Tax=Metarhizium rileyi (strain RCEF 4871) TaxID=1649241 RepID=A0A5C6GHW4_METRR|nr:hypothetical protein ED733_008680 [Metarhizium rileyi]